jgi:hypothetical protein
MGWPMMRTAISSLLVSTVRSCSLMRMTWLVIRLMMVPPVLVMAGQVQGPLVIPPNITPAAAVPALVRGLLEDCRRLSDLIPLELGATPRAQQLTVRLRTLLEAVGQLDRVLRLRESNPHRERQAVREVRQAYLPVFESLSQPGLNAPGTRRVNERIGLKITAIESALQIPWKPSDVSLEERLQRALIREYTGMIAELDTFMAALNDRVPEGPQIRTESLALRDAARRLRRFTAQGAADRRIVQELAAAVDAHRLVSSRVERVNRGRVPGPNVIRLRSIGEALARIQAGATTN